MEFAIRCLSFSLSLFLPRSPSPLTRQSAADRIFGGDFENSAPCRVFFWPLFVR